MAELIEEFIAELTALAYNWRMDWSDFDGRTLRNQIDDLVSEYRKGKIGTTHRDEKRELEEELARW
jgi:hypothetical protein